MSTDTPALPQTFEANRDKFQDAQETLSLPDSVIDTAIMIYKQSYSNNLYHGRPIEDILSACLHLACRIEQYPCTPTKLAELFNTDQNKVLKTARHFETKLGLKTAPANPTAYIEQFSSNLSISPETRSLALNILEAYTENGLDSGKSPTGLAAGALYAATRETGERITQSVLSEEADVAEVTIRNIYKQQLETYQSTTTEADQPTETTQTDTLELTTD